MRDFTEQEKESIYQRNQCPFCGCDRFREGPSAGLTTNYECAGCEARFNIAVGSLIQMGQVLCGPQRSLQRLPPEPVAPAPQKKQRSRLARALDTTWGSGLALALFVAFLCLVFYLSRPS